MASFVDVVVVDNNHESVASVDDDDDECDVRGTVDIVNPSFRVSVGEWGRDSVPEEEEVVRYGASNCTMGVVVTRSVLNCAPVACHVRGWTVMTAGS